jgi:hypothetical protein
MVSKLAHSQSLSYRGMNFRVCVAPRLYAVRLAVGDAQETVANVYGRVHREAASLRRAKDR